MFGKSKLKELIFIAICFVLIWLICGISNEVNATVSGNVIELSKESYNEETNILQVNVVLKAGVSLKKLDLSIAYSNANKVPYNNEQDIWRNDGIPMTINTLNVDSGEIAIIFDESATCKDITSDMIICRISFKLNGEGNILEEDIPDNIFELNSVAVLDDDDVYEEEDLVKINPMAKKLEGFTVDNVVFDKSTYIHGDTVQLVSGKGILTYSNTKDSGKTRNIDLTDEKYNITQNQTIADCNSPYINFSYKNQTSNNVQIQVKDKIEYMQIKEGYNTQYKYGDNLDKENIEIQIKFASKTQETVKNLAELEEAGIINILGFNSKQGPKQTINQEVTLDVNYEEYSYSDELKLNLTIVDEIQSYEWIEKPSKKEYKYGENLDTNGGKIKIKYISTTYDETIYGVINVIADMVKELDGNNFDSTVLGIRNLKVKCDDRNYLNYEIEVKDYIKEIAIIPPTKLEYDYGANKLDLTNGKVSIKWASDELNPITKELKDLDIVTEESVVNEGLEIIGFDSSIPGEQTITLKYYYTENNEIKTATKEYEIKIIYKIESISLTNNKMTIPYGYKITDTDLQNGNYKLVITRTGNNVSYIPVTADMLKYNAQGNIGEQTGYVIYKYVEDGIEKTKQLEFYITLENYLKDIELSHNNITINYGDQLDKNTLNNNYILTPVMANGDKLENKFIRDFINKIDTNREGTFKTKVKYQGIEKDFIIKIEDPILEILLEDDEKEKIKDKYKYNEILELNGAKLTIRKSSGDIKIDLTNDMIKNYNPQYVGVQSLNIEYEGKILEKAIDVEVEDYIIDIILVKPEKLTYLPGEELDLTGATVQTLYASGKLGQLESVTMEMISGYNKDGMGTQRLTVSYEGFTKTFDIIISVQTGIRR